VQKFLRDDAERIGAPSPDYRDLSIVDSPKLGLVNLPGNEAREIVEQDRAALLPPFPSGGTADQRSLSSCDLMMLIAKFNTNGLIVGSAESLRDIIRKSGAKIDGIGKTRSRATSLPLLCSSKFCPTHRTRAASYSSTGILDASSPPRISHIPAPFLPNSCRWYKIWFKP
jgi:hypothetical protein